MTIHFFYNPIWMPTERHVSVFSCPVPENAKFENFDQYEPFLTIYYYQLVLKSLNDDKAQLLNWYNQYIEQIDLSHGIDSIVQLLMNSDKFRFLIKSLQNRILIGNDDVHYFSNEVVSTCYENMNFHLLLIQVAELYQNEASITKMEINDEEIDEYYWDNIEEEEEEEDPFNVINQLKSLTYLFAKEFFERIIQESDKYRLDFEQVTVLSKMLRIITNSHKYKLKGYFLFSVKEGNSYDNYQFQEIELDSDGLKLSNGGYITIDKSMGGDSYSDIIYPTDEDDDAMYTAQLVNNFFEEFLEKLESDYCDFEILDSGDEIIER